MARAPVIVDVLTLRNDLHVAIARHTRTGRNQFADDHVLFEPEQRIVLALDRRIGEHARRLLEARRREERLGRKRCLRDAEQYRIGRQEARVAAVDDLHLTQHAAHDDLDVLVVDVDALRAIDLLHFLDQIVLQSRLAFDAQNVVRVERAFVELVAHLDLLAVLHQEMGARRDLVLALFAVSVGDIDDSLVALVA